MKFLNLNSLLAAVNKAGELQVAVGSGSCADVSNYVMQEAMQADAFRSVTFWGFDDQGNNIVAIKSVN